MKVYYLFIILFLQTFNQIELWQDNFKYVKPFREAMNEEMRKDETILLMGEEVAEYNGAYKVSQGMLDEFGAKRCN